MVSMRSFEAILATTLAVGVSGCAGNPATAHHDAGGDATVDARPGADASGDAGATVDAMPTDGGTLAGTLAVIAQDVSLTPVGSARPPDVGFHARAGAYVTAYTWVLPGPAFRTEVRALTVDATGMVHVSSPVTADGDGFPHDAQDAAIAVPADGADVPALAIWDDSRHDPGGSQEIFAAFVRATGGDAPTVALSGAAFDVSMRAATTQVLPAGAWDGAAMHFLVVWADDRERGVRDPDARVIFGRTVAADGTLGAESRIGDDMLFQTFPQVASCGSGRALVVWTDYRTESPGHLVTQYRGRLVDTATGTPVSPIVQYGEDSMIPPDVPAVACDSRHGTWLVGWTAHGPPSSKQVVVTPVAADGTPGAPVVVTAQPDGARAPRIAYVRGTNGWALAHLAQDSTAGYVLELDPFAHAASPDHPLTPAPPPLGTFYAGIAAHPTLAEAVVVMTLDYDRVDATVLRGPTSLP